MLAQRSNGVCLLHVSTAADSVTGNRQTLSATPDAGQRSAIIYSIVVSCQRHGIDPLVYLKDVRTRLPAMTNQDDIAALTPAKWKPVTLVS